jgi:hypothetical protein
MHNAQCLAAWRLPTRFWASSISMAHKTARPIPGGHNVHGAANAMSAPRHRLYAKVAELPQITRDANIWSQGRDDEQSRRADCRILS